MQKPSKVGHLLESNCVAVQPLGLVNSGFTWGFCSLAVCPRLPLLCDVVPISTTSFGICTYTYVYYVICTFTNTYIYIYFYIKYNKYVPIYKQMEPTLQHHPEVNIYTNHQNFQPRTEGGPATEPSRLQLLSIWVLGWQRTSGLDLVASFVSIFQRHPSSEGSDVTPRWYRWAQTPTVTWSSFQATF